MKLRRASLLKLNKLTKEEHTSKCKNFKYLLENASYNFYPISRRRPFIKEIHEHNTITDKNTFKLILFAYINGISQNVFTEYLYTSILNTSSKIKKRTNQIH